MNLYFYAALIVKNCGIEYEAANKVCEQKRSGVTLTVLCNPNLKTRNLEHKTEVVETIAMQKSVNLIPTISPQWKF